MIDSCHSHSNRPQQPIGTIMLKHCTTNRAELIPRDICARPNTFELRLVAQRNVDQDSLTTTVPATSGGDLCSTRSVHAQTPLAPSVGKPLKPLRKSISSDSAFSLLPISDRYWLSADTKQDRVIWCDKLNACLRNIRTWNVNATRPMRRN